MDGAKVPAYILIAVGITVLGYGIVGLQSGGSVGPVGIGIVGAAFGILLLTRNKDSE